MFVACKLLSSFGFNRCWQDLSSCSSREISPGTRCTLLVIRTKAPGFRSSSLGLQFEHKRAFADKLLSVKSHLVEGKTQLKAIDCIIKQPSELWFINAYCLLFIDSRINLKLWLQIIIAIRSNYGLENLLRFEFGSWRARRQSER